MRVNTNIAALVAQRNIFNTDSQFVKSVERLSSGLRINRAADDAAGLSISEKLRAQARGVNQAARNAQDAISMIQTAEGAENEMHAMLQRMRELAVQSANGTLSNSPDRVAMQAEVTSLLSEIDAIASRVTFNGINLINTTATVTFQVGPATDSTMGVVFSAVTTNALGLAPAGGSAISVGTVAGATSAIASLDTAINSLSTFRGTLGAAQNRLEYAIRSLQVQAENMTAAESRIRDVDVAAQTVEFSRVQIVRQAGISVLAQANIAPNAILALLR